MAEALAIKSRARPAVHVHAWLLLAALLDGVWIFNLLTLLRYPAPSAGEASVVIQATAFLRTGGRLNPLQRDVLAEIGGTWLYQPLLGPWLQSLAIRSVGLSLYSVRVVSLIFGLALLVACYTIAKRLRGPVAGLLAVVLLAFSGSFATSAHLARTEVMVAAFGYAAIALCLRDRGTTFPLTSALAGLAIACALAVQPSGVIYGPAVAAVILLDRDPPRRQIRRLLGVVGGACAGLVFWMALFARLLPVAPSGPASLGSLFARVMADASPVVLLRSILDTAVLLAQASYLRLPLVAAALIVLILGRSASRRELLALCAALFLGFAVVVPIKSPTDQILLTPMVEVLVAALLARILELERIPACPGRRPGAPSSVPPTRGGRVFDSLPESGREGESLAARLDRRWSRWSVGLTLAATWGLAIASIFWSLASLRANAFEDYLATVGRIQQAVPRGSVLVGDRAFWFAFSDQPYVTWQEVDDAARAQPALPLDDVLRGYHPSYLVVGQPAPNAVDTLLTHHGEPTAEIQTESLGDVRVYRVTWP